MLTRNWPRHLLCLSLSLPLGSALACGPDFLMRLLDDRGQSLAEMPEGNFNFEINRLGKTIAGLKNVTAVTYNPDDYSADSSEPNAARDKAEQVGLSAEQQAQVKQLRSLTDARQVELQGASLAPELRLYVAGAVAFGAGDHQLAADYFRQVLALPADQRPLRSTWAAYSLGRALFAMTEEAGDALTRLEDARDAFRQARQLSIDGFSDPLELGVASLGEEARVLRKAGDWNSAIELYATQNLHGSNVGYTSLKLLMNDLAEQPEDQLVKLLRGTAVQQLVTASLSVDLAGLLATSRRTRKTDQAVAGQHPRQPRQRRSSGRDELPTGRLRQRQGVPRTRWRQRPGLVAAGQTGGARW